MKIEETQGFQETLFRGANLWVLFRGHRAPKVAPFQERFLHFSNKNINLNQQFFEGLNFRFLGDFILLQDREGWKKNRNGRVQS